jgi:hypothetical protein
MGKLGFYGMRMMIVRTRTDHKGNGVHRTNGNCQPGGVNEKMRDVWNVIRDQGPSMRGHFPREKEE